MKCYGCDGAGGEWFDSCSVCRGTGIIKGIEEMPNRPQDPPVESYSLHMAPGISRPTSPPPPRKKTSETPMIASAFKRVCDLQEQLKYVNSMLLASWERERRIQSEYEKVMAKLGKHECPNCGETDQETIVDCDPGETGDTTRYCNSCFFSWPDC